jgi:hypothetical protein
MTILAKVLLTIVCAGVGGLQLRPMMQLQTTPVLRAVQLSRALPMMQAEQPPEEGYQTFYDDEKEDKVLKAKPAISDSMRKRLINEQRGLGADSNSQNPFLYVFAGVGIFVLLGAVAVNL